MFCESIFSAQVMHSHKCVQSSKKIENKVEKEFHLISETLFGDILHCEKKIVFPSVFVQRFIPI